jgi:hypothetical protein
LKFGYGVGIGERMFGNEFGENQKCKIEKMTILLFDHHDGHKVGPIVAILGKNIAKYKDMPYGGRSDIKNGRQRCFSAKYFLQE